MKSIRVLLVGLLLIAATALAGCADPPGDLLDSSPTPTSSATATPAKTQSPTASPSVTASAPATTTPQQKLSIELRGDCNPNGGEIRVKASGYTQRGEYMTRVEMMPTDEYEPEAGFDNTGVASAEGTLPNWKWDCTGEEPGDYRVTIIDLTTWNEASDQFTVLMP